MSAESPERGLFARGSVAVPTGREASAFDREAIQHRGVPQPALMESAGRAAADLVEALHRRGRIAVLAGGGNNGGDAIVAARTLAARGRHVDVFVVAGRPHPDPLGHGWPLEPTSLEGLDPADFQRRLAGASVVVDGLLGTGLSSAPRPEAARTIAAVHRAGRPVISLDVPSGVVADTGEVPGEAIVAECTIAFGWPKLGCLLEPGRAHSGRLVVAEIGFPPLPESTFTGTLFTPAWFDGVRPRRATATHKNQVGALLVVGGSEGMAGAVILAARAALRSGAGFVRVASAAAHREVLQSGLPDAPFVDVADPGQLDEAVLSSRAVVIGPGLAPSPAGEALLRRVLEAEVPVVLDAGALTLLAGGAAGGLSGLAGASAGRPARVLTPHPGEMARLQGCSVSEVQRDRPGAARALAEASAATVVLKGAPTLVAESGCALGISGLTSSDLAVAGMGDVLAGSIGALLAQGVGAWASAGAALLAGARAAQRAGLGRGLSASDVPDHLPGAFAESGPGRTDLPFSWVTLDMPAPS